MAATLNPFDPNFKLVVCNGPTLPPGMTKADYVPCDFNGLMLQAQFLINAMFVLGVLAAILTLTYAGILYISGDQKKINDAKDLLKNVGIGFLMMFSAWVIIYQILDWLVANPGVKILLGN